MDSIDAKRLVLQRAGVLRAAADAAATEDATLDEALGDSNEPRATAARSAVRRTLVAFCVPMTRKPLFDGATIEMLVGTERVAEAVVHAADHVVIDLPPAPAPLRLPPMVLASVGARPERAQMAPSVIEHAPRRLRALPVGPLAPTMPRRPLPIPSAAPVALVALPVEQLESPEQRFRCVPYQVTMNAGACLKRQTELGQTRLGRGHGQMTMPAAATRFHFCVGCALGAQVTDQLRRCSVEAAE